MNSAAPTPAGGKSYRISRAISTAMQAGAKAVAAASQPAPRSSPSQSSRGTLLDGRCAESQTGVPHSGHRPSRGRPKRL